MPPTADNAGTSPAGYPFRLFQWFFLAALVCLPLRFGAVQLWVLSVYIGVTAAAFGVYFLSRLFSKRNFTVRSSLYLWIAVYGMAFTLSAAYSDIPSRTLAEGYKLAGVVLSFVAALYYCREKKDIKRLASALVWLGVLLSLFGLLQHLGALAKNWWSFKNFVSANYVNHNHFANLLEMIIPLSLGLAVAERDDAKKPLHWFFFGLMVLTHVTTLSRGGYMGLSLGLGVMSAVLWRRGFVRGTWVWALGILFAVAVAVMFLGADTILARLATLKTTDPREHNPHRILMWQGTLELIKHTFWLGSGPGTFDLAFLKYRPLEFLEWRAVHAHCDALELLADCGVAGFLAVIPLVFLILRRGFFIAFDSQDPFKIAMASAVSAGFIGFMTHSLVDFNFHIPANFIILSVLVAMLFALRGHDRYLSRMPEWMVRLATASLIAACLYGTWIWGSSDLHMDTGKAKFARRDYPEAQKSFERAVAVNGFNDEAYFYLGHCLVRNRKPEAALKAYDRAITLNPLEPYYDFERTNTFLFNLKGDLGQAVRAYKHMLTKDAMDRDLYYFSGRGIYVRGVETGDRSHEAQALEWMRTAVNRNHNYLKDAYEVLWKDGRDLDKLERFVPMDASAAARMIEFLESKGLWRYHRKYLLMSLGLEDPMKGLGGRSAVSWQADPQADLTLGDLKFKGSGEITSGDIFFTNGEVSRLVDIKEGLSRVLIRGRGIPAGGVYPYLVVTLDGKVADAVYLNSSFETRFYAVLRTTPGRHELGLRYMNDGIHKRRKEDRNIQIRQVQIQYPVQPGNLEN